MPEKEQKPDSALDEVLREVEDAEKRVRDSDEQRARRGEAGDATSPDEGAQKDAAGE